MSFYDTLQAPPEYWSNMYFNSITLNEPISIPNTTFAATLATGTTITVPSNLNYAGTFCTGFTGTAQSVNNINNPNFNYATGVFTTPVAGNWNFEAGVLYSGVTAATGNVWQAVVGISTPGETSTPYANTTVSVPAAASSIVIFQTSRVIHLPAGSLVAMYTQQNSGASWALTGSSNYYVFFNGYLVPS